MESGPLLAGEEVYRGEGRSNRDLIIWKAV